MTVFTQNSTFTFGKYKGTGKTVGQALEDDPKYLRWCLENVGFFQVGRTLRAAILNRAEEAGQPGNCKNPDYPDCMECCGYPDCDKCRYGYDS